MKRNFKFLTLLTSPLTVIPFVCSCSNQQSRYLFWDVIQNGQNIRYKPTYSNKPEKTIEYEDAQEFGLDFVKSKTFYLEEDYLTTFTNVPFDKPDTVQKRKFGIRINKIENKDSKNYISYETYEEYSADYEHDLGKHIVIKYSRKWIYNNFEFTISPPIKDGSTYWYLRPISDLKTLQANSEWSAIGHLEKEYYINGVKQDIGYELELENKTYNKDNIVSEAVYQCLPKQTQLLYLDKVDVNHGYVELAKSVLDKGISLQEKNITLHEFSTIKLNLPAGKKIGDAELIIGDTTLTKDSGLEFFTNEIDIPGEKVNNSKVQVKSITLEDIA